MRSLNKHEMRILVSIMLNNRARYTDLNIDKLPTNQFNYHLKLLLGAGYIEKKSTYYQLTEKGEDLAGNIDIFSNDLEKQGKISAVAICLKEDGGVQYYLMQKRKKQPYYGFCGFPAGKIKFGHLFANEVLRELKEETGLTGTASLNSIAHVLVTNPAGNEIINDFIYFKCLVTDFQGDLQEETLEGTNRWMTLEDIKHETLVFPGVVRTIESLSTKVFSFWEGTEIYKVEEAKASTKRPASSPTRLNQRVA